jgi:hypothetical protein
VTHHYLLVTYDRVMVTLADQIGFEVLDPVQD